MFLAESWDVFLKKLFCKLSVYTSTLGLTKLANGLYYPQGTYSWIMDEGVA